MGAAVRHVFMAAGRDIIMEQRQRGSDLEHFARELCAGRGRFRLPGSCLVFCNSKNQSHDGCLPGRIRLRRKAESKMQMGGAYPEAFASELRMSHSALSLPEKSLIPASGQGDLGFPAVAK